VEGHILEDSGETHYLNILKKQSRVLNINYLNTHYGVKIIKEMTMYNVLKEIEQRVDDLRTAFNDACDGDGDIGEARELLDDLYESL
jgi:hypothetical protein